MAHSAVIQLPHNWLLDFLPFFSHWVYRLTTRVHSLKSDTKSWQRDQVQALKFIRSKFCLRWMWLERIFKYEKAAIWNISKTKIIHSLFCRLERRKLVAKWKSNGVLMFCAGPMCVRRVNTNSIQRKLCVSVFALPIAMLLLRLCVLSFCVC